MKFDDGADGGSAMIGGVGRANVGSVMVGGVQW